MEENKNLKREDLTDDSLIRVFNEYGGEVFYITEYGKRKIAAHSFRDVPLKELKKLILQDGYNGLFTKGYLVIKDERVRNIFSLEPLKGSNLDAEQMKALLDSEDQKEIESFLQYCSDANLDKIIRVAVDKNESNFNTIRLLADYSGIDIIGLMEEKKETAKAAANKSVNAPRQKVTAKSGDEESTPIRRIKR